MQLPGLQEVVLSLRTLPRETAGALAIGALARLPGRRSRSRSRRQKGRGAVGWFFVQALGGAASGSRLRRARLPKLPPVRPSSSLPRPRAGVRASA